jgi:NO-binding membrane sensor protein with MHYT domain
MDAMSPLQTTVTNEEFAPLGARRLFLLGGIGLIIVGMIFGDIFAVFILHQNTSRVGGSLAAAAQAALAGDASAAKSHFQNVGAFLENRGTKVDTHVHMIDFGYLTLLLAIVEPWIAFSPAAKRRMAWIFLLGAWLLPIGVFLIHYVGLAHSPFQTIGWASVLADFGGLLVILVVLACLAGLWKHLRAPSRQLDEDELMTTCVAATPLLLSGGVLLIVLGFFSGAWYAAVDLYRHEAQDFTNLSEITAAASSNDATTLDRALNDYGRLQGDKAVKIAAHAHAIEFGLLAMMLAFFQPYVALREVWRGRWAAALLLGSLLLPVCVFLESRFGLVAGGLADIGGLLVILALLAMWVGILRHTGHLDARATELHQETRL